MMNSISSFIFTISNKLFPGKFSKDSFMLSIKNIQWIGLSKLLGMVISFITVSIVARSFGPEKFGTINYILSFVGLFSIFATLGVSAVVYREAIKEKEAREEILGSSIALTFFTGILTIGIIFIYLFVTKERLDITLLVLLASLSFLTQPLSLLHVDFLKDSEAKYVTITQVITSFIANGAKILTVLMYGSIWLFILILTLENLLSGCIYVYQIIKIKKRTLNLKISFARIRSILYSSLPYAISLSFMDIYAKIDQVMLRHYVDMSSVGLYAAATRVTELWYFIPNIIITGLYPILAKKEISPEERKKRFLFLSKALAYVAILISILVLVFSKNIISIIYGAHFIAAVPILSIYIFSLLGTFVSLLILQEIFIEGRTWKVIIIPGCNALLNIILNIFLIPLYGVNGAAVATVISYNLIPIVYYVSKKYSV